MKCGAVKGQVLDRRIMRPLESAGDDLQSSPTTAISQAQSWEEIAEFWETHSLADYWDQTREVEFEVRAKRGHWITLDPDVDRGESWPTT
jgi:hypothetical protein